MGVTHVISLFIPRFTISYRFQSYVLNTEVYASMGFEVTAPGQPRVPILHVQHGLQEVTHPTSSSMSIAVS